MKLPIFLNIAFTFGSYVSDPVELMPFLFLFSYSELFVSFFVRSQKSKWRRGMCPSVASHLRSLLLFVLLMSW
jgi:hypothetical protein